MIKVSNVSKSFGQIKAVDNLSFEIKQGEIVGFLGPNGAGKTTTLRLISGFLMADQGEIIIADIPISKKTIEAQKIIGYLPENNPLYKNFLVSEFLNLSLELKNVPKKLRKSALDFVVEAIGINNVFYRPIGELSKGYKQRVGIAATLLHQPRIIIMDEPTEGLDPNQRAEIRSLIKTLAKDRTIIMSTHVMQEVQAICNRIIIINKGRLVADGTPEELSRIVSNQRVLIIDIEGDEVESALKNLTGLKNISIESIKNKRLQAKLIVNEDIELRPEISKLAQKYGWIIWKLVEQEQKLEDIFHQLTN
jgi:ABC-2 type transport system ATP-binding protein